METNQKITDINNLRKASSCFKADCKIRMIRTGNIYTSSIKSKNGTNPAILNHTPRSAKIFREDGLLHDCIDCLDKVIEEYIFRKEGTKLLVKTHLFVICHV